MQLDNNAKANPILTNMNEYRYSEQELANYVIGFMVRTEDGKNTFEQIRNALEYALDNLDDHKEGIQRVEDEKNNGLEMAKELSGFSCSMSTKSFKFIQNVIMSGKCSDKQAVVVKAIYHQVMNSFIGTASGSLDNEDILDINGQEAYDFC